MNGCQYLLGACFKNIFSLFIKKINIFFRKSWFGGQSEHFYCSEFLGDLLVMVLDEPLRLLGAHIWLKAWSEWVVDD